MTGSEKAVRRILSMASVTFVSFNFQILSLKILFLEQFCPRGTNMMPSIKAPEKQDIASIETL